jgi:ribokinase
MGSYDVICIGDAKLDTFLKINDTEGKFRYDESTNEICFKHGEKIPVENTHISVGGNAANVAIGLARLGIKSTIAAEIGDDEFSLKIINAFAREHIDRGFIKQNRGTDSSFSVAISYKNDRTLFSEHFKREHNFSYDHATAKWLYLTSLGEEWTGAYQKAVNYASEKHAQIAFNPGTIQLTEKAPVVESILRITDILFVNKEEAKQLIYDYANEYNSDDIQDILSNVRALGPKTAVITDSDNGSYVLDAENNYYHQDRIECDVVELTGAGDSYATGFLAARIHGLSTQESMLWGSHNAASVIGSIGAEEGLLKKDILEERVYESR